MIKMIIVIGAFVGLGLLVYNTYKCWNNGKS